MTKQEKNLTSLLRLVLMLAVGAVASCGDGDSAKKKVTAAEPPDELSQWAIQVYVENDSERTLVKLPPVKEVSFGRAAGAALEHAKPGASPKPPEGLLSKLSPRPGAATDESKPGSGSGTKSLAGGKSGTKALVGRTQRPLRAPRTPAPKVV